MVNNADELQSNLEPMNEVDGPVFKIRNDPRCTWVGRCMRVLSLDELPLFWNVLCGDMSLVGPRPPLPQEVERYEPWQRRRLRIRPGLTCLWALEGRSQLQFERWVKLDLLYIDNWSMWLDFKILLKTIPVVLFGKGAHYTLLYRRSPWFLLSSLLIIPQDFWRDLLILCSGKPIS